MQNLFYVNNMLILKVMKISVSRSFTKGSHIVRESQICTKIKFIKKLKFNNTSLSEMLLLVIVSSVIVVHLASEFFIARRRAWVLIHGVGR